MHHQAHPTEGHIRLDQHAINNGDDCQHVVPRPRFLSDPRAHVDGA
jgi:hypothetical protein